MKSRITSAKFVGRYKPRPCSSLLLLDGEIMLGLVFESVCFCVFSTYVKINPIHLASRDEAGYFSLFKKNTGEIAKVKKTQINYWAWAL